MPFILVHFSCFRSRHNALFARRSPTRVSFCSFRSLAVAIQRNCSSNAILLRRLLSRRRLGSWRPQCLPREAGGGVVQAVRAQLVDCLPKRPLCAAWHITRVFYEKVLVNSLILILVDKRLFVILLQRCIPIMSQKYYVDYESQHADLWPKVWASLHPSDICCAKVLDFELACSKQQNRYLHRNTSAFSLTCGPISRKGILPVSRSLPSP